MSEIFSPCSIHEHSANLFSITFGAIEDYIEYLQDQDGQGGGYSWESMIKAVLELRSIVLPDVDFDSESDMFAAASSNKSSLLVIASVIKELSEDRKLMGQAISHAKGEGYFE